MMYFIAGNTQKCPEFCLCNGCLVTINGNATWNVLQQNPFKNGGLLGENRVLRNYEGFVYLKP